MAVVNQGKKQGTKRGLKEANNSLRISDECSESAPQEDSNRPSMPKEKKNTRGKTKLQVMATGQKHRKEVVWNHRGQPVGEVSKRFSSTLGLIAREVVPINVQSWDKVEKTTKTTAWGLLMQKYIVDVCHCPLILRMMGKLWRNWKSELSVQIRRICESKSDVTRHIALLKPDDVQQNEWDQFVKERMSDKWKEKSEKMRKVRAHLTLPHTLSRKGYARLEDEFIKENPDKPPLTRPELWIKGHEPKKAKMTDAVATTIRDIKEKMSEIPATVDQNSIPIKEDALTMVLGKERSGHVRALGFGVTPSKVDAQILNSSWKQQLTNELNELKDRQKILEDFILQFRLTTNQNKSGDGIGPSSTGTPLNQNKSGDGIRLSSTGTPLSPKGTNQDQSNINLTNAKCNLLNWDATGQVVARAEIASTDPSSLVHHVLVGPDCYKVWVKEILVPQVPLFRCSREFFVLEDAFGSTVAWPHKYINFD